MSPHHQNGTDHSKAPLERSKYGGIKPTRTNWLVIPVKPFHAAKSRLSTVLSQDERAALSRRLLQNVLSAAQASIHIDYITVISSDQTVLHDAHTFGATPLFEQPNPQGGYGLNAALHQARAHMMQTGGDSMLILPSDLPLIKANDIDTLYTYDTPVVIAPSHDGGTNALLLRPPQGIDFAFGIDSFRKHCVLAEDAGLQYSVYDSPSLAHDVDQPDDLGLLL